MEAFAWFSHKYIMHGIMWRWHESHHKNHHSILEKNDLFSIIFGLLAIILILIGSIFEKYQLLTWIGGGVTLYGIFYFIFHDIIVHKRVKHQLSFRNKYLKRIIKAHHIHHKLSTKEGAEAFGFLYADKKYSSKNNS
jgi:beta-carotene 3-hydroxylase